MKHEWYIPIYAFGDDPDSSSGTTVGTTIYSKIEDVFGFEPDAIGFIVLRGYLPSKNEHDKMEHFDHFNNKFFEE